MSEDLRHTAIAVTLKAFETMFFLPLEPQPPEWKADPVFLSAAPDFLRGEIAFQGKWSGKVKLYLPLELGKMLTKNWMGSEEDEISQSNTIDTVSELCNVLCGNLLSHLDRKSPHTLMIPQSKAISIEEMKEDISPGATTIDFDAESQWVRLMIQLDHHGTDGEGGKT